jgi:hypothetical protein
VLPERLVWHLLALEAEGTTLGHMTRAFEDRF